MSRQEQHIDESPHKVLVTGAAGFIGSHVTELLCAEGKKVICLVKKSSNLQYIQHLPVEIRYGDLTDSQTLIHATKDVDAVIHIAAIAKDWGNYKTFHRVNVVGTLNVLKACKTNGINNIIITGSVASYGEEDAKEVKDEASPFNSHYPYFADSLFTCGMNHYRDSKAQCTIEVIQFAENNNLNLTILEPVFVYGEREFSSGFYEYMKTIQTGIPFFIGSKKNKFHVVYVKDLARAYSLVLKKKTTGINRLIIGNHKAHRMHTVFGLFCQELGKRQPINLPKAWIYPFAFLLEFFYTVFRATEPPLLTRGRVNMFYDNIEYATSKAEKELGFKNVYSLETGIKKTVKWYRDNNLI